MSSSAPALEREEPASRARFTTLLLALGVIYPILWIVMDVAGSLMYPGYSYRDQTISEIGAYGAPTREFWLAFSAVLDLFIVMFAAGIWLSAGRRHRLRLYAVILAGTTIVGLLLSPFDAIHQRAVIAAGTATFSDSLHVTIVVLGSIVFFVEASLAASTLKGRFRLFTIAIVVTGLVFGLGTASYGSAVQDGRSTPWIGIVERTWAYAFEAWLVVFALTLIASQRRRMA